MPSVRSVNDAAPYWWANSAAERYWVEIRRLERPGLTLWAPTLDEVGNTNAWYELVNTVREGEVIYHYNARESRFVGRSIAASDAVEDVVDEAYTVELRDFNTIDAPVDLGVLRANADAIYGMRDRLFAEYGLPALPAVPVHR